MTTKGATIGLKERIIIFRKRGVIVVITRGENQKIAGKQYAEDRAYSKGEKVCGRGSSI